jgi:hypothetical protein
MVCDPGRDVNLGGAAGSPLQPNGSCTCAPSHSLSRPIFGRWTGNGGVQPSHMARASVVLSCLCAPTVALALSSCSAVPAGPASHAGTRSSSATGRAHPARYEAPGLRPRRVAASVVASWERSERAFYRAGRYERPRMRSLLRTFESDSPALAGTESWLAVMHQAGIGGARRWRVGNARVIRLGPSTARLTGCSWDSGSVYLVDGRGAPRSLGGGPGLTASRVCLHLVAGRWLVFSAKTEAVSSPRKAGPCRGF